MGFLASTVFPDYCKNSHCVVLSSRFLLSEVKSNVLVPEVDLIRLSNPPPHPDCEILRYSEVQALRQLFSNLCQHKLGLFICYLLSYLWVYLVTLLLLHLMGLTVVWKMTLIFKLEDCFLELVKEISPGFL